MIQITELTEYQKSQMKPWAEKWIKIGLQTGETDWERFEENIKICYKKAGIKFPNKIVRVHSPIVGAFAASIANEILSKNRSKKDAVEVAVGDAVRGAVGVAVEDAVEVAVGDAVRGAVEGAVGVAVGDAVGDAVRGAVGVAVERAVGCAIGGSVRDAVRSKLSWHYWLGGQFWVGGWHYGSSVVTFFADVCGIKLEKDIVERLRAYQSINESVNYMWLNSDFIMVCARPSKIHLDAQGRLHCDGGKAIEYPDGWGLYRLHGVEVPEYLAVTKESDLDIKWYMKQQNADVKAEFVRKYGVERMLSFGKKVDDWKKHTGHEFYTKMWEKSEYELWDMSKLFEGVAYQPYLKMRNQTTGIWHAEAVSPACRDLVAALKERMGGQLFKIVSIK